MKKKPFLILIAGGAGAGKTTTATKIIKHIQQKEKNKNSAVVLQTDQLTNVKLKNHNPPYLKDGITDFVEVGKYYGNISNYDEDLILSKIKKITDSEQTKVIVLEGVVALSFNKINNFAGLQIFVNIDDDIKLIRRIKRSSYYKELVGESVEGGTRDFGDSIKESFDLWMWRKKVRSADHDYNRDIKSKEKCADLVLSNNYPEDLEENIRKITMFIDLYFENEELFKNQLERKGLKEEPRNNPQVTKLQEELKILKEEKKFWENKEKKLNQKVKQLTVLLEQQNQKKEMQFEEPPKRN